MKSTNQKQRGEGFTTSVGRALRRAAKVARKTARMAEQERCEPVLLQIAEIAKKYRPEQEPWATLRNQLHPRHVPRTDALPRWTRLVSHSGVTANDGSPRTGWLSCLD